MLSYLPLEPLRLDPFLEHLNFVLIKRLNIIDHTLLLLLLLRLDFSELFLLFKQFILLQITRQLVYLLAKPHLLGIPLKHQRLLLEQQLLFKLLVSQLNELHLPLLNPSPSQLLLNQAATLRLLNMFLLPQQLLILPLLDSHPIHHLVLLLLTLRLT